MIRVALFRGLLACSLARGACYYPPVPNIVGGPEGALQSKAESAYNSILLIMAQGYRLNDRYIKPVVEKAENEVQDSLAFLPKDIKKLVFGYIWWADVESRCRELGSDEAQPITGFDLVYGQLAGDYQRTFGSLYKAIESEKKDFWAQTSHLDVLNRFLDGFTHLEPAYEPSPYRFTLGHITQHFCQVCGKKGEAVGLERQLSRLTFSHDKVGPILQHIPYPTIGISDLLHLVLKGSSETYDCECGSTFAVTSRENFVQAPHLLLLHLSQKLSKDIRVSKYIDLYPRHGRPALEYELYGATFVNSMRGVESSISTLLRGPRDMWYVYSDGSRAKQNNPFNPQEELINHLISDNEEAGDASNCEDMAGFYPELMLYKRK